MRAIDAEGSELQTQLKIIREAEYQIYGSGSWGFTAKCEHAIEDAPTIQPDNGLQKLADEIASFKRCVKSENSDYLTGYLSALSVVEGMIVDMREVTNGN